MMGSAMSEHGERCDELVADCRVRAATDLLVHQWDPVVLTALRMRPHRRRELRTAIGGISDKALTEALRRLLANGLVSRSAYAAAPPRVDFSLTKLGTSLVDGPIKALGHWILEHGDELLDAQEHAREGAGVMSATISASGSKVVGRQGA